MLFLVSVLLGCCFKNDYMSTRQVIMAGSYLTYLFQIFTLGAGILFLRFNLNLSRIRSVLWIESLFVFLAIYILLNILCFGISKYGLQAYLRYLYIVGVFL